jgi:hypothetical protein
VAKCAIASRKAISSTVGSEGDDTGRSRPE